MGYNITHPHTILNDQRCFQNNGIKLDMDAKK